MSNHKLNLQGFFHRLGSLYRKITKTFVHRLLRYVLRYQRRGNLSTAGFILPTTVLLILVVALTVGALTFRAYNRNIQVIGEAQQRVIYNAATPAIDRARSKLEYLFDSTKDSRLPSGVPAQDTLEAMLLNNGQDRQGGAFGSIRLRDKDGKATIDPYTFPDERRIFKDGKAQNMWAFQTDTDGDGKIDPSKDSTTIYSIILNTPPTQTTGTGSNTKTEKIATRLLKMKDEDKAKAMYVRQAPLSVDGALGCNISERGGKATGPDGWFDDKVSTAILRKNFQVDALVIPGNSKDTKATLEFTQDRQMNRGNKWGAWFRHDLEIHPGATFNWNGAMHTEGSLIVGGTNFSAYLISSPASCLYYPDSSEITVTDTRPTQPGETNRNLLGLVTSGMVKDGNQNGSATIHLHSNQPQDNRNWATLEVGTSSSKATNPFNITLDPEVVLLEDGYRSMSATDRTNRGANLNTAKQSLPDFGISKHSPPQKLDQRIYASTQPAPYVDDLYRADDRWGPKPRYGKDITIPPGDYGKPIPPDDSNAALLKSEADAIDKEASNLGLDGYWERRARAVGMRILVGQRLELGNLFTWYAPEDKNNDGYVGSPSGDPGRFIDQNVYEHEGDPLYPPTVKPYPVTSASTTAVGQTSHIALHRRTLRDNLSAVQSTAIYHSESDEKDYPVACLATTVHPGTLLTLRQSLTFKSFNFKGTDNATDGSLLTNFFTGVGTNGWEFNTPAGNASNFKAAIENTDSPLRKALDNLANFAGDYNPNEKDANGNPKTGAFPPTPNDTIIHPYPKLSMWGDYSSLKRALADVATKGYDKLSIADKTYLQTAACTIGMLAYNINEIQKFDPSNPANDRALSGSTRRLMAVLADDLRLLMDGTIVSGDGRPLTSNPEVLPQERLRTYNYSATPAAPATPQPSNPPFRAQYRLKDYQEVPPEAFIGALRAYLLSSSGKNLAPDSQQFMDEMRMAEMIMLNHQIRRDRTFGFRESTIFGEYAIITPDSVADPDAPSNPFQSLPTACDPDQFTLNGDDLPLSIDRIPSSIQQKASTVLAEGKLSSAPPEDFPTYFRSSDDRTRTRFSQYRLALSRLCGTISDRGNTVLPKFPSLYYLFPEVNHDRYGEKDTYHGQPLQEPYIGNGEAPLSEPPNSARRDDYLDDYLESMKSQFKRISDTKAPGRAGYPSVPFSATSPGSLLSRRPIENQPVFPIEDYSVADVALTPRRLDEWQIPYLAPGSVRPFDSAVSNTRANYSTNLILIPKEGNVNELDRIAIPFLDRAFFDGRQLMLTRSLDIDLGMLRSTRFGSKNNTWLPLSGIVYGFREDAVREDAISRPRCSGTSCKMDVRNPAAPVDPQVGSNGISTKAIDEYPDPDRRIHGFRLRNGAQLMRNRSFEGVIVDAVDNNRGLSFFTDQPAYIQGDFNLHQDGTDDTIGTRLEEFTQLLPDSRAYNGTDFYTGDRNNATRRDTKFAVPSSDRWRPSEVLADSISILSNNFCDGTISDMFVQFNGSAINTSGFASNAYPVPDFSSISDFGNPSASRSYYHQPSRGLFDPGCRTANFTSFHNQNRPSTRLGNPADNNGNKVDGNRNTGWDWVRENSRYNATAPRRSSSNNYAEGSWVDFAAPIKISRTGQPLVARPRDKTSSSLDASRPEETPPQRSTNPAGLRRDELLPPVPYNIAFSNPYSAYGNSGGNRRTVTATPSRVNSIIVSGISPSRPQQGYGGLHNFPRFLENWGGQAMHFAGSFIQLQYTNYATAPYELENLEPGDTTNRGDENINYYNAPPRYWGYDVGLQLSAAGPAASRFVSSSKNRSEFYVEPPANDPYITSLCEAAKTAFSLSTNCPK
ncbi:MAG: hormogonium polysaccharide biosynthesis protein HpsA [Leptolyngbya sp. UWPOB_LEPTO1]|uniref:hormogonium polysaccharide biosynthesis protein HpsA n=1 Tax=Leptolyngbya sp. UWPOB_LEPTO1 TaxID=2815653 RepID=UPI001AD4B214|nr:hormogonium polysaccharide biosynthesis protein HpsA [Leptolyngbya sp. UWPOB_LEPTO1]MBN8560959.1 hormogonium polysaccharide biosynthesis protein HpsA [Leptolyngbya sp. UWPOB_LEPTO1]